MKLLNRSMLLGIIIGLLIDLIGVADGVWTSKDIKWVFITYAIALAILSYINWGVLIYKSKKEKLYQATTDNPEVSVVEVQLDAIRNAKTDTEAWEAFKLADNQALDKYNKVKKEAHKKYRAVVDPIWKEYEEAYTRYRKAFDKRDRENTYEIEQIAKTPAEPIPTSKLELDKKEKP